MSINTPRAQEAQYVRDLAAGQDVWCDWADSVARTADGFCQYCGRTDHSPYNPAEDDARAGGGSR